MKGINTQGWTKPDGTPDRPQLLQGRARRVRASSVRAVFEVPSRARHRPGRPFTVGDILIGGQHGSVRWPGGRGRHGQARRCRHSPGIDHQRRRGRARGGETIATRASRSSNWPTSRATASCRSRSPTRHTCSLRVVNPVGRARRWLARWPIMCARRPTCSRHNQLFRQLACPPRAVRLLTSSRRGSRSGDLVRRIAAARRGDGDRLLRRRPVRRRPRRALGRARRSRSTPLLPGAAANWSVGGPANEADILVVVASDRAGGRSRPPCVILRSQLVGSRRSSPTGAHDLVGEFKGREHFGFRDGISQPGCEAGLRAARGDYITRRLIAPRTPPLACGPVRASRSCGPASSSSAIRNRTRWTRCGPQPPATRGPGLGDGTDRSSSSGVCVRTSPASGAARADMRKRSAGRASPT